MDRLARKPEGDAAGFQVLRDGDRVKLSERQIERIMQMFASLRFQTNGDIPDQLLSEMGRSRNVATEALKEAIAKMTGGRFERLRAEYLRGLEDIINPRPMEFVSSPD